MKASELKTAKTAFTNILKKRVDRYKMIQSGLTVSENYKEDWIKYQRVITELEFIQNDVSNLTLKKLQNLLK